MTKNIIFNSKREFFPIMGKAQAMIDDEAILVKNPIKRLPNMVCVIDSNNGVFDTLFPIETDDDFKLLIKDSRKITFFLYHIPYYGNDPNPDYQKEIRKIELNKKDSKLVSKTVQKPSIRQINDAEGFDDFD